MTPQQRRKRGRELGHALLELWPPWFGRGEAAGDGVVSKGASSRRTPWALGELGTGRVRWPAGGSGSESTERRRWAPKGSAIGLLMCQSLSLTAQACSVCKYWQCLVHRSRYVTTATIQNWDWSRGLPFHEPGRLHISLNWDTT